MVVRIVWLKGVVGRLWLYSLLLFGSFDVVFVFVVKWERVRVDVRKVVRVR